MSHDVSTEFWKANSQNLLQYMALHLALTPLAHTYNPYITHYSSFHFLFHYLYITPIYTSSFHFLFHYPIITPKPLPQRSWNGHLPSALLGLSVGRFPKRISGLPEWTPHVGTHQFPEGTLYTR